MASQPAVVARAHSHIIASPFGTIHAATFSLPRPIGTAIPKPFTTELIALNAGNPLGDQPGNAPLDYPAPNRQKKADALVPRERADTAEQAAMAAARASNFPDYEFSVSPPSTADTVELPYQDLPPADLVAAARAATRASPADSSKILFGIDPTDTLQSIVPWQPGEEPVIVSPNADPDIKLSALAPQKNTTEDAATEGVTIAHKGEVTGPDQRPKSPAERLGLLADSKQRAKAEKCLANAVYFEARGEVVRGQIAVAQVVMNRVFSGYYPNDVCGVVYQNAHRHLACQFTFACDGIPDVVTEPDAWEIAKQIARDTLDGKFWMPEISRATHYHAYWVRPSWVGEMRRIFKLGVHTFYRPRLWNDGGEIPVWGDAAATREQADKMEAGRKG
jgi:spore germination cell wall hydrolase CwlJ-like protein